MRPQIRRREAEQERRGEGQDDVGDPDAEREEDQSAIGIHGRMALGARLGVRPGDDEGPDLVQQDGHRQDRCR